ncbi:MAG: DNA repair protein RadC [Candidatus Carbobacillus altaicus]|nr:DNA repair protein RadC [Candidatus Carbobacillus altaicus]
MRPSEKTLKLRELPPSERPRERLLSAGAHALSDSELIAILLRTGSKEVSVLHLAEQVLAHARSLRGLLEMDVSELMHLPGLGQAKAIQLKAALELGRRLTREMHARPVIKSPEDAANHLMDRLRYEWQEVFVVLFLNTKHEVIGEKDIFKGTLDASLVHPREVFREAVRMSAHALILAHNHPSGDPSPSREDREVTARFTEAGRLLGIDVLDHVIIGDGRYSSLREMNFLT